MPAKHNDIVIVGAGLSGLVTLRSLIESSSSSRIRNVHVVEAREKVGGRLQGSPNGGIDLGASWTWASDTGLRKLLRDLSINTVDQPWIGKVVQVSGTGTTKREAKFGESPCGPGGQRIQGGAHSIPTKLLEYINDLRSSNKIKWHMGASVTAIGSDLRTSVAVAPDEEDVVEVELSSGETLEALAVVLAVPPAAISKIEFLPELPPSRLMSLETTKTWMSDILKFAVIYNDRFWVEEGLSGFGTFEVSKIVECSWDATDGSTFSISGFARPTSILARGDAEEIKSAIISDLSRCYGEKASSPSSIHFIDWSYANFNVDQIQAQENHNQHLNYGSKELRSAFNRRVIFSGTESEDAAGTVPHFEWHSSLRSRSHNFAHPSRGSLRSSPPRAHGRSSTRWGSFS